MLSRFIVTLTEGIKILISLLTPPALRYPETFFLLPKHVAYGSMERSVPHSNPVPKSKDRGRTRKNIEEILLTCKFIYPPVPDLNDRRGARSLHKREKRASTLQKKNSERKIKPLFIIPFPLVPILARI